jgi:hypothetical protein
MRSLEEMRRKKVLDKNFHRQEELEHQFLDPACWEVVQVHALHPGNLEQLFRSAAWDAE